MSDEAPERLPRGPHGLSRDEVLASQRGRMLDALARAATEKGLRAVTVADILRRARVSRETFYQHFKDKDDATLAALETATGIVADGVRTGLELATTPAVEDRLRAMMTSYLTALQREPAFTRLFLLEIYAAGHEAVARRMQGQELFADVIAFVVESSGRRHPRLTYEFVVGAISAIVTKRAAVGELDTLTDLAEPLLALVVELLLI